MPTPDTTQLQVEVVPLASLHAHPRNYRRHPADQLTHIQQSLQAHGQYRNVVVAEDGQTILAGHGVALAAGELGWQELSVIRLPLAADDPRAIKVLIGDNEVAGRAEGDDRLLADLLHEVAELDDLLGSGYTPEMLANLALVTRTEIPDEDTARHWAGLPEMVNEEVQRVVLSCDTREEADQALELLGVTQVVNLRGGKLLSAWYPPREREDPASLRWAGQEQEADEAGQELEAEG